MALSSSLVMTYGVSQVGARVDLREKRAHGRGHDVVVLNARTVRSGKEGEGEGPALSPGI